MTHPEKESIQRMETALADVEVQTRDLPTRSEVTQAVQQSKRTSHVGIAIASIIAILVATFGVVIGIHNARDNAAIQARTALNDASIKSLNEANDTLKAAGLPEVPVPQNGETVNANALAQAAAALVLADPRFAGLTLADLRRQVDDYFREHPLPEGQKPTADQVIQAVTQIYAANPPAPGEPGRPPTPAEISAAVSAYCANDACRGTPGIPGANGTDGRNGENGKDAPPPTQAQINEAVRVYCDDNPTVCKSDMPGPSGPQPTGASFQWDAMVNGSRGCYYVTTYDNGQAIPAKVPDAQCPPRTPPPLPTEGG